MENDIIVSSANSKSSIFEGASPKFTFIMGVVVGVACVSLIGFVLAASYVFSGKTLGNKIGGSNNAVVGNQPTDQQPPAPLAKADIKLKSNEYIRGNKNAPVTVVMYSDLECPFCKRFHPTVQKVMQDYAGKVKMVFRHFPLSFHQNAQKEAEASECIGKLGGADKFWSFIDKVFERTTAGGTGIALDALPALAKEVGVSESKFKTCLDSGEMTAKVQADLQEGSGFGVGGTPTSFVNGTPVEGAVPYESIKAAIDEALKQ